MKKTSTVAVLLVKSNQPAIIELLSDEVEIQVLETALNSGQPNPLDHVYEFRTQVLKQEAEFGDYLEELLCQPFIHTEVRQHGVRWLKAQIRLENYQKTEKEAAKIIGEYAYKIFKQDPSKTDFMLASQSSQVRVRIFILPPLNNS